MEFRVLGPPEILGTGDDPVGERPLPLAGMRQREILAMLILQANRVVTVDTVIDALWGDDPPRTARRQVQNHMSALRSTLDRASARRSAIVTHPAGYRLDVRGDRVDVTEFLVQAASARLCARQGRLPDCGRHARAALRLWRGPALAGLRRAPGLAAEATRLDEDKLDVLALRFDSDLARGRHEDIVGELRQLIRAYPLRERFRGQLMVALYRCGRKADALAVFDSCRRMLVEESGLDPSAELSELRQAILLDNLGAAGVPPPATPPVEIRPRVDRPAQLTPPPPDFVGRVHERRRLLAALGTVSGGPPQLPVVTGPPGVGKTALAVQVAWHLVPRHPDGHLHLALRGEDGRPIDPHEVLADTLQALGIASADLPIGLSARAGLYRSLLAGRRLVVLLDDASDPAQLRPLLPGNATSTVLVTGTTRLAHLQGSDPIRLAPLTHAEGLELFTALVGHERVAGAAAAADRIVTACEGAPAATRVAAAWAAGLPDLGLDTVARFLEDNQCRARVLAADPRIRAAVVTRYERLARPLREAAGHLARSSLVRFTGRDLSVLTSVSESAAECLLADLADAELAEPVSAPHGRQGYRMSGLTRSFIRQLTVRPTTCEALDSSEALRTLGPPVYR